MFAPDVEITFPAEYGIQKREKFFEGLRNIDEFLSEGEQRAVALADFIAELEIGNSKTPVVFDDPVNSFDIDKKESLAKRIVELSKNRQVIVFTHDVIFSSYIFDLVSDEDNRKLNTNIANFHWLEKLGRKSGGVVANDYPRTDRLGPVIDKAKRIQGEMQYLNGSKKQEKIEQGYSYLRKALECYVVEGLFARVLRKWDERLYMHNLDKVQTDPNLYTNVRDLFGKFSKYEPGHQHSAEICAHFPSPEQYIKDLKQVELICCPKKMDKQN